MDKDKENQRIKELSKERYSDKGNVTEKWLRQYGQISITGDYQTNKACITEVFNMLDIVMQNRLDYLMSNSVRLNDKWIKGKQYWVFQRPDQEIIQFYPIQGFQNVVYALNEFGITSPKAIIETTRIARNLTTHGNETIVGEIVPLSYDFTCETLIHMADVLIDLGMLDPEYREPTFEQMRVYAGRKLCKDKYQIKRLVAEGGTSRVFLGEEINLHRDVAVKEYKPGKYDLQLASNERELLKKLRHPQIPEIYDFFFENGTYYIVMEYIRGITLEEYAVRNAVILTERLQILCLLADVLAFLHQEQNGIIYSDLKPQNVMIDRNGRVVLIDFGFTWKAGAEEQSVPGFSESFSAPELLRGNKPSLKSDIYSFGAVIKYLLDDAAFYPYQRDRYNSILLNSLNEDPDRRYSSFSRMKNDLNRIIDEPDQIEYEEKENTDRTPQIEFIKKEKVNNNSIVKVMGFVLAGMLILAGVLIFLLFKKKDNNIAQNDTLQEKTESFESSSDEMPVSETNTVDINGEYYISDGKWKFTDKTLWFYITVYNRTDDKLPFTKLYTKHEVEFDDGEVKTVTVVYTLPEIAAGEVKKDLAVKVSLSEMNVSDEREVNSVSIGNYYFE